MDFIERYGWRGNPGSRERVFILSEGSSLLEGVEVGPSSMLGEVRDYISVVLEKGQGQRGIKGKVEGHMNA